MPPKEVDSRIPEIRSRIEKTETTFRYLAELGVFSDGGQASDVSIYIGAARILLGENNEASALEAVTVAETSINRALRNKNIVWRCIFLHQLHIFLYHLVFMLALLNIATGRLEFVSPVLWTTQPIPMSALVSGGLGAILRGVWFLWMKVSQRAFRPQFTLAHLSAPWIGILLGLFTFLLLRAGILLIEGAGHSPGKSSDFDLAVCFLVGYKWESLLGWVDNVSLTSAKVKS